MFGSIDNFGVFNSESIIYRWTSFGARVADQRTVQYFGTRFIDSKCGRTRVAHRNDAEFNIRESDSAVETNLYILKWSMLQISEVQALVNFGVMSMLSGGEVAAWSTVLAVLLHDPRAVLR